MLRLRHSSRALTTADASTVTSPVVITSPSMLPSTTRSLRMINLPSRRSSTPRVTVPPLEFSPGRFPSALDITTDSFASGVALILSAVWSMSESFPYADGQARQSTAPVPPDPPDPEWPSATRYARHLEAYDDWSSGIHRRMGARLIEIASPLPGERLLDVGCGTGLVTQMAADRVGPSGEVFGVDI